MWTHLTLPGMLPQIPYSYIRNTMIMMEKGWTRLNWNTMLTVIRYLWGLPLMYVKVSPWKNVWNLPMKK